MTNKKRRVLIHSALASAIAAIGLRDFNAEARNPVRGSSGDAPSAIDVHIELRAAEEDIAIRPGKKTRVWRYRSKLVSGDADALEPSLGGYLGPGIRGRPGPQVNNNFFHKNLQNLHLVKCH